MKHLPRERFVIDPVWKPVDSGHYDRLWHIFLKECKECGFTGLDLEWSTREVPSLGDKRVQHKPKRMQSPVSIVQLSSLHATFVVKFTDLLNMVMKGSCVDPFAPFSHDWPHHRIGEKMNSAKHMAKIYRNIVLLLQDTAVVKVGVGIHGDQAKFQQDYPGLELGPCVDLVVLAEHYLLKGLFDAYANDVCGMLEGSDSVRSLKTMSAMFTGKTLNKDPFVVMSNWGGALGPLSRLQVEYAAADSEASFDVCRSILVRAGLVSDTILLPLSAPDASCLHLLEPFIAKKTKNAVCYAKKQYLCHTVTATLPSCEENLVLNHDGEAIGWCKGRLKRYYDNIDVFNPNMELVFKVHKAKAEWYVFKKRIAKVIGWTTERESGTERITKEISAIQLIFSTDPLKYNDAHIKRNLQYFKQAKENKCVVCGCADSLVRYAVVPLMYRKHFPRIYMSHNSYDFHLLCPPCFIRARTVYDQERNRVVKDFGIPLSHLSPPVLESFGRRVDAFEKNLRRTKEATTKDGTEAKDASIYDDSVAHHMAPALKIKIWREYLNVEENRAVIVNLMKYAKALRNHYRSQQQCNRCRPCVANELKSNLATTIPEDRLAELRTFVEAYAPRYPFFDPVTSSSEAQSYIFQTYGPSSVHGVEFILNSNANSNNFRAVLARFWAATYPEGLRTIPNATRAEEAPKVGRNGESEGRTANELPFVDSHSFFVIRMLMEKYMLSSDAVAPLAKEGEKVRCKSPDHAIGQFIYRWRQVFLKKMAPRHLPLGWEAGDGILY